MGYRTVSVVSSSALDAEVLSTALTVIPEEERDSVLHSFESFQAVEFIYGDSHKPKLSWSAGTNLNH